MKKTGVIRNYEIKDNEGHVIGTFSFELFGTIIWFTRRSNKLEKIIMRYVKELGDISPEGSGKTPEDEKLVRKAEERIKKLFKGCPGNVYDAFFTIHRPFAKVNDNFYFTGVLATIYRILDMEIKRMGV